MTGLTLLAKMKHTVCYLFGAYLMESYNRNPIKYSFDGIKLFRNAKDIRSKV